jgi:lysozyme family protein
MNLADLSPEYFALFESAVINPRRQAEVGGIVSRIVLHQDLYKAVEAACGTPWYVVAIIHNLECDLNFGQHLHNGDPLSRPTVDDPAGRPPGWLALAAEDRTWQRSAVDALAYDHLNFKDGWDVARICFECETFNGWGYRRRGIHSPYLWAGSQHYTAGKYVSDGVFDAGAVSDQIGAAVVLKQMVLSNVVALAAQPV